MNREPKKAKTVFLYSLDLSNLLTSLLGLWNNVGSFIFLFDTASCLLTLRFCALSSHASQDRDNVASCDTNATGLAVLKVDELDFTCDNDGTRLTVHRVAQVKVSLSRSDRAGSDNAINLRSSTDFSTPRKGSSSLPCIWRSHTTSSIRNEQSKKSVPSVTSEPRMQRVGFGCGVNAFHLDHSVQMDSVK